MVAGSRVVRQGVVTLANRLAGGQPRAFSTLSLGGLWQQTQAAAAASGQVPAAEPAVAAAGHAWRRVTGLLPSFCDILLAVPKKKVRCTLLHSSLNRSMGGRVLAPSCRR